VRQQRRVLRRQLDLQGLKVDTRRRVLQPPAITGRQLDADAPGAPARPRAPADSHAGLRAEPEIDGRARTDESDDTGCGRVAGSQRCHSAARQQV